MGRTNTMCRHTSEQTERMSMSDGPYCPYCIECEPDNTEGVQGSLDTEMMMFGLDLEDA